MGAPPDFNLTPAFALAAATAPFDTPFRAIDFKRSLRSPPRLLLPLLLLPAAASGSARRFPSGIALESDAADGGGTVNRCVCRIAVLLAEAPLPPPVVKAVEYAVLPPVEVPCVEPTLPWLCVPVAAFALPIGATLAAIESYAPTAMTPRPALLGVFAADPKPVAGASPLPSSSSLDVQRDRFAVFDLVAVASASSEKSPAFRLAQSRLQRLPSALQAARNEDNSLPGRLRASVLTTQSSTARGHGAALLSLSAAAAAAAAEPEAALAAEGADGGGADDGRGGAAVDGGGGGGGGSGGVASGCCCG